ncbi:MAG: hypothetical protein AAGD01_01325 [Acidobacteriota bacterium]
MSESQVESTVSLYDDPMVELYGKALEQLGQGKIAAARADFEKVVAESDLREVVDRARQMLLVCDSKESGELSVEDPYLAAVYHKNRGDLDSALELSRDGGRHLENGTWAFLEASILALQEQDEEAVEALRRAVSLEPSSRVHAYHDPDFGGLRRRAELDDLFEV